MCTVHTLRASSATSSVEVGDHMASAAGKSGRPFVRASIYPYSLHASVARTGDIGVGFVAYKQYFRGFQCQRLLPARS